MISRALGLSVGMVVRMALRAALHSDPYQVGDSYEAPDALDQHGKAYEVKVGEFRAVLTDTPGEGGDAAPPTDPQWFEQNRVLLPVNISGMSSIQRRIARGRMESKPFRILVVDDADVAARYPRQTGRLTVIFLNEKGVITRIGYAAPGKELQELFVPGAQCDFPFRASP